MSGKARRTIELTDDETMAVREAITEELSKNCQIVREHLAHHHAGSPVGLADTRIWLGQVATLAGVMDKLDPPGWRETLGAEAVA
jgi:hypothetical protein